MIETSVHEMITRRQFLRNAAIMLGSQCLPWALGFAQDTEEQADQTWTIGNELVKRVVAFREKTGSLFTRQFSDLSLDMNFILLGRTHTGTLEEFSFVCNGRKCTGGGNSFELDGASGSTMAYGKSLAVRLRHEELPIEVTVIYEVFDRHAALRKYLVLRNTDRPRFTYRI